MVKKSAHRGTFKKQVFDSLSNSKFTWRTANGISKEVGLDPKKVVHILENSPDIIRSSSANTSGEALYATREQYKEQTSLPKRIFSTIKNSTD
jgi:hypothetical protein